MDLVMPPMPFSAVAAPTGNASLVVPEEMRNIGLGTRIGLPPGVVQVIVTWQGAEPLAVRHHRGDQWEDVHVIPSAASGVQRSTGVLTLASDDTHQLRILHSTGRADRWEQETLDQGYVAGIQVMPMGTPADVTGGGSMLRVDDSVGTRVFLGDTMIHGDTGERNAHHLLSEHFTLWGGSGDPPTSPSSSTFCLLRRRGDRIYVSARIAASPSLAVYKRSGEFAAMSLPLGFRPNRGFILVGAWGSFSDGTRGICRARTTDLTVRDGEDQWKSGELVYLNASWSTNDSWPTSLPGTAA